MLAISLILALDWPLTLTLKAFVELLGSRFSMLFILPYLYTLTQSLLRAAKHALSTLQTVTNESS